LEGNVVGILGTFADITERKWVRRTAKAKEAAEAANQAKGKSQATMSHEIRRR